MTGNRKEPGQDEGSMLESAEPPPKARRYQRPISLFPLKPEEALRRAMSVPPPRKPKRAAKDEG